MKHRKLRIAWSVGWGLVAVLLIALWVRSCSRADIVAAPLSHSWYFVVGSPPGSLGVVIYKQNASGWVIDTESIDDFRRDSDAVAAFPDNWGRFIHMNVGPPITTFPDWFLIAISVVASAVPWLPWSNRFRLRTLFVWMLIAVGLGVIVCFLNIPPSPH